MIECRYGEYVVRDYEISFQYKLFISLVAFFSVLFIALGVYYFDASRQLYQEMSARAKIQAEEIALMPDLRQQVSRQDPQAIQAFMQQIAAHSDASFIVIGDRRACICFIPSIRSGSARGWLAAITRRYWREKHHHHPQRRTRGSLRSKAPIVDDAGGCRHCLRRLPHQLSRQHHADQSDQYFYRRRAAAHRPVYLLLVLYPQHQKADFFARAAEIGLLVRQQKAMMESIFEGVIVIDRQRRIEVINHAARSLLGLSQPARQLRGQSIDSVISPQPFFASGDMLESDTHDELCRFNQLTVLASRVRIMLENTLQGWVITFRDRNEINSLSAQLSQVKRYVDNLRIMRHEQLNRMTTLSGLLHMGHYDEAIRYIQAQSEHAQELLDFISSHFHSPTLCGLLLGKAARAREKGVALSFDPACRIDRPLPSLMESELISIIGNLLDNAIEATQRAELPHEPVEVLIQLNARELMIEVADRGVGIRPDIRERIFERGVTTKTRGDHGIGLYLIEHYVTQAGGTIEVADNAPRGTIFTLFIPPTGSPSATGGPLCIMTWSMC
jgi:two-component system cit operon sensor histidine kinase CitA